MKKILLLMMWLMVGYAMAQDVIVKKDGSTIVSRVTEITQMEVRYKLFSNLTGPSYSILKSEIQVINYENGEKETFEGKIIEPSLDIQNQDYSYEQLTEMKTSRMALFTNSLFDKKIKRLKLTGWIGGGLLASAGIVTIIAGIVKRTDDLKGEDFYYNGEVHHISNSHDNDYVVMIALGSSLVGASAAWTTAFLVRAKNLQKRHGLTVSATPLFQRDFQLNNGTTLTAGVDMLRDSRLNNRTLGLGVRYCF